VPRKICQSSARVCTHKSTTLIDVRLGPHKRRKSGPFPNRRFVPTAAVSNRSKAGPYSMTSSAVASKVGGTDVLGLGRIEINQQDQVCGARLRPARPVAHQATNKREFSVSVDSWQTISQSDMRGTSMRSR
jgi:hypothetical protein